MSWQEEKQGLVRQILEARKEVTFRDRSLSVPAWLKFSPYFGQEGTEWKVSKYPGRGWVDRIPELWSEQRVRDYLYQCVTIDDLRKEARR